MGESEWIKYSDTKFFKVLDRKGTQFEAKNNCSAIDSTLITIGSEKEQIFLSQLLAKYRGISGNVWIGLEYVGNKFEWIDGSFMTYQNWDENAVKDGINKCVDMLTYESDFGQWLDDRCTKKHLMACQKIQVPKTVIDEVKTLSNFIENQQNELKSHQDQIYTLKKRVEEKFDKEINSFNSLIEKQQNELNGHQLQMEKLQDQLDKQQEEIDSLIPIGFLYTQFPYQSSPQQLWPSLQCTEVTQQYAGLFFRAQGNVSLPFGQIQNDNAPHLKKIWASPNANYRGTVETVLGNWSNFVATGFWNNSDIPNTVSLRFFMSDGEVRPKNMAIKIWKRSG